MTKSPGADLSPRTLLTACRAGLAATIGFSLLINLLVLSVPIYSMQVFDRVLHTGSLETLTYLTLITLAGLALTSWLDFTRSRILQELGIWLERRVAPEVLLASFGQPSQPGVPGSQLLRDIALFRQFIGGPALVAFCDMPWVPVYVTALWLLHPLLGTTVLILAIVLVGLAALSELATRKPLRVASDLAMAGLRHAEASDRQREAATVLGMAPRLVERWLASNEAALRLQSSAGSRANALLTLSKFARMAGQVLILGAAAYLVLRQETTGGVLMAASIIMARALAPVEQAIGSWRGLVAARGAWQRVRVGMAQAQAQRPGTSLPRPDGQLSAERVTVAAGPGTGAVLRGVSFTVEPGRVLAVAGPSGAGKSTLARAIVGALPPLDGRLLLDGAKISTWNRAELSRHIGYLPQDASMFEGTVRENIARGDADAAIDDVVAAARLAGVHELVLRLPQGYDTRLGEQSVILPPGQRRRIALARALFGNPCLLVLDEPDANLDGDGEGALMRAIDGAKARGTAVVVLSNRTSLLRSADDVLVLRDGMVERFGPRDAVFKHSVRPQPVAVQAAG